MRIDLAKHTRGSIHFAGEGFGRMARDSARLNLHEEMHPRIINVIPEEITSIHFSFFNGMFAESMKRMGRGRFMQKYSFETHPHMEGQIQSFVLQLSSSVRSNDINSIVQRAMKGSVEDIVHLHKRGLL